MPEQINDSSLIGQTLHEWTIQEYEQHQRGTAWYIIMFILGTFLVVFSLLKGNFLFALVIMLFAIILFLQTKQAPLQLVFRITDLGVIVGNRFYSYSELDSFYFIYQPPQVKTLYFETKSAFRPLLPIPLLDVNPLDVRTSLLEFLSEDVEKEQEPVSDQIARNWRFH